jgi:hypothetical protein
MKLENYWLDYNHPTLNQSINKREDTKAAILNVTLYDIVWWYIEIDHTRIVIVLVKTHLDEA